MFSLRGLFPTFEKPVMRPRYLNLEPQRHDFRGVGTVLLLAASCGVALALWEPSSRATTPFVTASVEKSKSEPAGVSKVAMQETTAAAEAEDDQPALTVKLSTFCSQRTTARRDCAGVKAFKEARIKATEPPALAKTEAAPVVAKAEPVAAKTVTAEQAEPVSTPSKSAEPVSIVPVRPEAPAVQPPQRAASAPKAKRPRATDHAPAERLVRVYDQMLPDGRRVPVYRRASGGYEYGSVVDGEYRPRRANLEPPYGARRFGLQ